MEKIKMILKNKYIKTALIVLSVICCLVVIAGLNQPNMSPFTSLLDIRQPLVAAYSEEIIAVVDDQNTRMLIVDTDGMELRAVVDATLSRSPVERIENIAISGGRIYATGASYYHHGAYVSSESVVEYDTDGRYIRTVYSHAYKEDEKVNTLQFADILPHNNQLFLTVCSGNTVSVLEISDNARKIASWTLPELVYAAGYSPADPAGIAIGSSQNCYYLENSGEIKKLSFSEYIRDLLEYFNVSDTGIDVSIFEKCYGFPSVVLDPGGTSRYYCLISPDEEAMLVLSDGLSIDYDVSSLRCSPGMIIKSSLFWIAAAVVALEAAALILWLLIFKTDSRTRSSLLVIGIVIFVSVFYSRQIMEVSEKSYYSSLSTQTKQLSNVLTEYYGETLSKLRKEDVAAVLSDVDNQKDIYELHDILKEMCDANPVDQSCYASVCVYGEDKKLYLVSDSSYEFYPGTVISLGDSAETALVESDHSPITAEMYSDTIVLDYEYIRGPEGDVVGVFSVSGLRGNLDYVQTQNTVKMAVNLISMLIGIYMCVTMINKFSSDLHRRKRRDEDDVLGKSLDMAGIFSFMHGIILGLDSVIVVYVAKSLCTDMPAGQQALMVAMPMTAATIGSLIGGAAASYICPKTGDRKAATLAAALSGASLLLAAYAVVTGSIYLYILAKFLFGLFFNIIFVLKETMPFRAQEEKERRNVRASVTKSSFAPTIISALIGGYVAQYLSYGAIYVTGAVLSGLYIIICMMSFTKDAPEKSNAVSSDNMGKDRLKYIKMYLKGPGGVLVLCYALPLMILAGYKSYLFPMYTSGAGISPLFLSNVSVFVSAISFALYDDLKKAASKYSRLSVMVVPMLFICACLICFILSPNIYWAIAVLLIYEILYRIANSSTWMYVADVARGEGLNAKKAYSRYLVISNILNSIQAPVLSQFVTLGIHFACAAAGAISAVLFGLFGIYNRRHDINAEADRRKKS